MSSAGPQQPELNPGTGSRSSGRGLRSLPGFTTAAVVFVLIVLLGIGGVAIANWNQTATVAIAITAGAAATTSPPPTTTPPTTTPPTTAPPAGPGNIVPISASFYRPGKVTGNVQCAANNGQSGKVTFTWPVVSPGASSYVVSLRSMNTTTVFSETKPSVTAQSTTFDLDNKSGAYGNYLLRIQGMSNGVASDPSYTRMGFGANGPSSCNPWTAELPPPLGAFTVSAAPGSPAARSNVLELIFSPSQATQYVVSIESATSVRYGTEFTVTSPQATLSFPPRVTGSSGSDIQADYYGDYKLRIMPLKANPDGSLTPGDPVTKVIRYYANYFTMGDN